MADLNRDTGFYSQFLEEYESELLATIAWPGTTVEVVSVQASRALISTIARYPEGLLPAGILSPTELEKVALSTPERLFSQRFLDKYGDVSSAIRNLDSVQNSTIIDTSGGGNAIFVPVAIAVSATVAIILAAGVVSCVALKLFGTDARGLRQTKYNLSNMSGTQPLMGLPERRGIGPQDLMQISSKELLEALKNARVLGKGGQAVVYRANLPRVLREPVAIKKLMGAGLPHLGGGGWSFVEEARALHQLGSNPHIISIYAVCPEECALVMELGHERQASLHDCLAQEPFLPWRKRLEFMYDIASALWHVHGQRMLHRDIKPANIIIKQDGSSALLADFGMADEMLESGVVSLGDSRYDAHLHVGTAVYKDPFTVQTFRPASDMYSLGVTIVEVVTGQMAHRVQERLTSVGSWSDAGSQRHDVKKELLNLIDDRDGVAGPGDADKQNWCKCASIMLDLALDCLCQDYSSRRSADSVVGVLVEVMRMSAAEDSGKPTSPLHSCWAEEDSQRLPPSTAPLSSGRRAAIKEQIQWHWHLIEKIVEYCHNSHVNFEQVRREKRLAYFGKAIEYAVQPEVGLLTAKRAKEYKEKNDWGNAAKHQRGRWVDIEREFKAKKASDSGKTLNKSSDAPVSSNLPDIPLEGIEKVERQVRHHLELARMCEKEGHKGGKIRKGKSIYENFCRTLNFAEKHKLITQERKAELEAINEEGNRWKHEELPFNVKPQSGLSGIMSGQISLQIVIEETPGELPLGPPPPHQQSQYERADLLESLG